jgi:acyl carrier protein
MSLEDVFSIEISPKEGSTLSTISDLMDLVRLKRPERR